MTTAPLSFDIAYSIHPFFAGINYFCIQKRKIFRELSGQNVYPRSLTPKSPDAIIENEKVFGVAAGKNVLMKKPGEYLSLFRSLGREWKWLLGYILRYKLEIILYVAMGVVGTAMGLGTSIATKYLIDAVVEHNSAVIATAVSCAVGLSVFQIVLGALVSRVAAVVGTRISNQVRGGIYEHIVRCRWEAVSKFHSGELINRLEGDVSAVSDSIISFVPSVFTRLTQFFGSLAIVLYYDPTMAVFALMSAPVMFFISRFTAKMIRKFNQETRTMNGQVLSFSEESIQNLQTLKAFDLTPDYSGKFADLLEQYRNIRLAHDKFSLLLSVGMSLLGLVVSFACYGWGVWRLWQGAISYGTMTMFLQISGKLTSSFSALVGLAPGAISIATAAGRIMELMELPREEDADREQALQMLPEARKTGVFICGEELTYSYSDGDTPVLQKASFHAAPGETVAFVGPSGEGKTTLLRLLLGLVAPSGGRLTMEVGGMAPLNISDSTRRFCAYVPQGSAVFSGSVAENLRIAAPDATDQELTEALKTADAMDFVRKLPLGMDTLIGERGVNFSEGQIQRLAIARALLRKAPVLLLDEATSALDGWTEERVLENLMASDKARTCILTTHRPSMLKYCTRVYRVTEQGDLTVEYPLGTK